MWMESNSKLACQFAKYELFEGNQKFTLAVLNAQGCRWPERMSTLKMKEIP
jgi:hypothetical protein